MVQLLLFMLIQQAMAVLGQLLLKKGMGDAGAFAWTAEFWGRHVFLNLWLQVGLILLIVANVFWLWILNKYPFSIVYPLTSLGFIFSVISGMIIFHESVGYLQWIGVVMVMLGCFFIARV